jgi:hypothetical protein
VLPIGGFDGQDPTPTLDEFKAMIKNGELRYVQVGGGMGGPGNNEGSSEISTWVTANCTLDANAPVSGSLYLCTPVK